MVGRVEAQLAQLKVQLPPPAAPAANYVPYNFAGGMLYVSGQLPKDNSGKMLEGQLGDLTVEKGQEAARLCAVNLVAQLKAALGDLDRVKKIVKITCFVNSKSDFTQQPAVANGASDFLVSVFGKEVGRHARCALGAAQLPFNVAVEMEAQVEVEGTVDTSNL